MRKFTIKEAIKFGWNKTEKFWKIMVIIGAVSIGINLLQNILDTIISGGNKDNMGVISSALILVLSIVFMIIGAWTGYNIIKMGFKIINDEKPHIKEMFHYKNEKMRIFKWFVSNIIYGIILMISPIVLFAISYYSGFNNILFIIVMLLSVLPSIYFSLKYWPIKYIMIDKKIGIIEAFKESGEITKGNKVKLLLFMLASAGIITLGLICLIVGVIPAIMVVYIAQLHVYKKLAA